MKVELVRRDDMDNVEMIWAVGEKYTVTKYVDGTYSAAFDPGEDERRRIRYSTYERSED